ncbi:uncharacterized protein DUF4386 [Planomicrobium soli]|uniref:Uncharacterized protein DUF4386 n=1 Tax=Planomicrobium soli TaxID=1176648 RepID=A0A2P8H6N4_9BACL|nr:DUF4386 domain-containing protein [Planomicrobium soli]PSL41844.1 uncharacterized protein DUF4386 [Planomicrobium soli]
MKSSKRTAKLIGVLFLLAAASAIAGVLLYDPILNSADYLNQGSNHDNQVLLGAFMELILVVSAIGTATAMFPLLRKYDETIALLHVCFRFLEAIVITIGIVSVLALLTVSREFAAASAPDTAAFQAVGISLIAIHDWTFMLGPLFFLGINTIMYSFIFFKSKLVPSALALLGITGAILVFICALLVLFGAIQQVSILGGLLALPIAVYEITLAVWLIRKGFNESEEAVVPVRNDAPAY